MLCAITLVSNAAAQTGGRVKRFVAVTIDDLPVVSTQRSAQARQRITADLLKHIKQARVPAIGFVNETQLFDGDKRNEDSVALLRQWLDAGLELGNHTFSHKSLHQIALEEYTADILRGEIVIKELSKAGNKPVRYFRHPYLQTGRSLEVKQQLNEFLAAHNYTIAPVTIDNADWIFARAYDNAVARSDKPLQARIGAAYLIYLNDKMDYWERQSIKLFGREPQQILLLHANSINADYFDDAARMLKKRGYRFITLADALRDPVYKTPDEFVGKGGISWLHRWATAKGKEFVLADEPKTPEFVMKEAGVTAE